MKTPIVILNFKTYLESCGDDALNLAKALQSVQEETGIKMVACPQACDIYRIKNETSIDVLSQHIDAITPGSNTGSTLFEGVLASGIDGSLLNHSEKRLTLADIQEVNQKLIDNNLISCICTNNVETSVAAATFNPDIVAIEPPELIGSGISVSQAEPEIVEGTVDKVKAINSNVKVLCGAGISTGEDMAQALELGAEGVLLASGIVKADNPKDALLDLVSKI
ncbi:triose-phosphate isomerase [uncultured Methanobrevibacter sp.]|uniref:triose-phosphate isomerase n=1 Tax=uncultured Methanobrevibacter sp. TaxID=253161 RepID=UPI0025F59958|nr:triose-phosphate isomerase [uncultured Methanobrevibacter sp.]